MPAAARAAAFTFTASGSTSGTTILTGVPAGCSTNPACTVTVSAPVGTNTAVQVLLFRTTDGSGTPLAVGTATTSFIANQATSTGFPLNGVMASFTVQPPTVTQGKPASFTPTINALDAAGETLAAGYVTKQYATPGPFTATVSDATGQTTVSGVSLIKYSGSGAGPATITMTTAGYAPASASMTYASPPPLVPTFAAAFISCVESTNTTTVDEYGSSPPVPVRQFVYQTCSSTPLRFDVNGTLWGGPLGIKSDGTSAGTLGISDELLAFDLNGNVYATNTTSNALNVYATSSGTPSLVRFIQNAGSICSAAVDLQSNLYVGLCNGGVTEYAAGSATVLASDSAAYPPIAVDRSGNVYALNAAKALVAYTPGLFGHGSPQTTSCTASSIKDLAVDTVGNLYVASAAFALLNYTGTLVAIPAAAIQSSNCVSASSTIGIGGAVTVTTPMK